MRIRLMFLIFLIGVNIPLMAVYPASAPIASMTTFPTFGISYTAPADARFEITDAPTHIGLYRFSPSSPLAGGLILVEILPAKGKSLAEISDAIATQTLMAKTSAPFTVGGEPAVRLNGDFREQELARRSVYVVIHEGRGYVFSAIAKGSLDIGNPLDNLVKSVVFSPPESPIKNLGTFFDVPFAVFDRITINGPACLRRFDNKPQELNIGFLDFSSSPMPVDQFHIDIQRIIIPGAKKFGDLRDNYSIGLQKQLNTDEKFIWRTDADLPGLNISQPIHSTVKLPGDKEGTYTNRFCILELGNDEYIQFLFCDSSDKETDIKAISDLSEKMLATIKILPKKSDPKP